MLSRSLSALVMAGACAGLLGGLHPAARAQHDATASRPLGANDVRDVLMRIHGASIERNFEGVFVVSSGGLVSSARITHYCDGRNQYEFIETMDGRPRRVYRHNEVVHTLWPQDRVALIEQRDSLATFPGLLRGGEDRIVESYEVRSLGEDRVADRVAEVIRLDPRDEFRYGHRLWADKASGLLLRAEIFDARKDVVLESSAFSEVTLGIRTQPHAVTKPMKRLDGYRVVRAAPQPTTLADEGWTLDPPAPGFRLVSSMRRPLAQGGERAEDRQPEPQVIQAIFSDGLTSVSVFIERFDPERHAEPMAGMQGATHTLARRQGDAWVTAVGDVPGETLRRFADALGPRK